MRGAAPVSSGSALDIVLRRTWQPRAAWQQLGRIKGAFDTGMNANRVHEVFPYLRVRAAEAAVQFYTKVFGATEKFLLTEPGGGSGTWSWTSETPYSCPPTSFRRTTVLLLGSRVRPAWSFTFTATTATSLPRVPLPRSLDAARCLVTAPVRGRPRTTAR